MAKQLTSIELCAGAGGQALGLHLAGFKHRLLVEIEPAQLKNGTHIRTLLGMPPDNESGIDKSDPRRIECVDCMHCDKAGTEYPCSICWNPIGDMFEAKAQPAKQQRTFVTCQCCKGAGEIEVSNW